MCFIANFIEMSRDAHLSVLEQAFCKYGAFKAHFYRKHISPTPVTDKITLSTFKCAVALCERQFTDSKVVIAHLKDHFEEGREVTCPPRGCTSVFTVKSSFTAHMSRKHKNFADGGISDWYKDCAPQSCPTVEAELLNCGPDISEAGTETVPIEVDSELSEDFRDLFLRNISLFYLKLQGQFLLPASTIQTIVEEIQNIHELGQSYTLDNLTTLLKTNTTLSDEGIAKLCEAVKGSDLFSACHKGPMRTTYSRVQSFKEMFNYVEPKKNFLGQSQNRTDQFAYYVPLRETLKCLLNSDLWQKCVTGEQSAGSSSDVLCDISDGRIFKSNNFFDTNPSCLKLLLYQDAFEVVNPLGSAKTKHKVLAVYVSVANLPVHVRSDTDHMFLVLLCREKDFREFGHANVFSELLTDLKELEENGIVTSDKTVVKGTLFCIAGDNLGSDCIGGFCENFSRTHHFCRYCLMTQSDFQSGDPNQCGAERTKETYNSAVERLKTEEMGDMDQSSISNAITKVLPDLAPSVLGIVVETLQSLGVETTEDFDFVQESDLMSVLRLIQARKLVAAWKKNSQSTEIHIQSSLSSSTSPTSSSVSLSPSPGRVLAVLDWVDSFQIPWDKFPEALLQCLERGKRPAPKLRREMIRIVASEMMKVSASPSKQASTEVAKKLIAKYPQSLQDVIEGDVVGSGYHSLVKQLQARIENVKRSSTPRIKKRKECSDDSLTDEVPAEKKAAVQDTYGCIKWDMKFMPVTETTESQEKK
ncbi:unnamed protein product [Oreochromis niloticus]|nr:unnamed protein product [Mustela putorius furo]